MSPSALKLPFALMLAFGVITGVHAQSAAAHETAVLPILNNDSGKLEGVLILEPTGETGAGARWSFGDSSLTAAFGLQAGNSLGLLCNNRNGVAGTIGNLAGCQLAASGNGIQGSHRTNASLSLDSSSGTVGVVAGSGQDTLPAWLMSNNTGSSRVERNDLTIFAEKNIGSTGVVSIGGTMARARVVTAVERPSLVEQWNSKSLRIGGGIGNFRANIVGRVIDVPGQPEQWQGLGIGLTWRTPWSGKLTIGAENVVTRGRNPFSPNNGSDEDEGTVPYVRYQQDL